MGDLGQRCTCGSLLHQQATVWHSLYDCGVLLVARSDRLSNNDDTAPDAVIAPGARLEVSQSEVIHQTGHEEYPIGCGDLQMRAAEACRALAGDVVCLRRTSRAVTREGAEQCSMRALSRYDYKCVSD